MMYLKDTAISNLRIRKLKVFFLILGIILGITTVVTLTSITIAMERQLEDRFESQGTRLLVTPESQALSLSYNGVSVASGVAFEAPVLPQKVLEDVIELKDKGVSIVSPKLVQPAEVASNKVLITGIEFNSEQKLKNYWEIQGQLPDENGLLVGKGIKDKLGISIGESFKIQGNTFKVEGILNETGAAEDKLIFMNLNKLQELFNRKGQLTFIELNVVEDLEGTLNEQLNEVTSSLKERNPGIDVSAVKGQDEARKEVVDRFAKFSLLVSIVVLFIGSLIVLTTMMSSVRERTKEIGVFRAIGFRQSHIIKIILTEALIISVIGGVVGYLSGVLLAKIAAPYIAQIDVQIGWNIGVGLLAIIISSAVGLLSSAYPAYQAAQLDPVEAFRSL